MDRLGILPLLLVTACGAGGKFDASSPITVRSAGLGSSYEQRGVSLDQGDMLDKLSERPATRDDVQKARTLQTVAVILGATGGALIGWPIGSAIGGDPDPAWILAGIGAGVVVVSIPFSISSSSSVAKAVKAHNDSFESRKSSKRQEPSLPDKPW
jgi:hypothetical protein